jgi:hypothetical protein
VLAVAALVSGLTLTCAVTTGEASARQDGVRQPVIRYACDWQLQTVGFQVHDQGEWKRLTFSDDGLTNTTVVKVDDDVAEFGSDDGRWLERQVPLPNDDDGKARPGHYSRWVFKDVHVTQTVEVVASRTGRQDACVIRYTLENRGAAARRVGLRTMIDTEVNTNDGAPFRVPGQPVLKRADFGVNVPVPAALEVLGDANPRPGDLTAVLTLQVGGGLEGPGRVSVTHWPGVSALGLNWDVPVRDSGFDSAAVLYWPPAQLAPGEQRRLGFAYGLGVVESAETR